MKRDLCEILGALRAQRRPSSAKTGVLQRWRLGGLEEGASVSETKGDGVGGHSEQGNI